jgi:hypothetical protein
LRRELEGAVERVDWKVPSKLADRKVRWKLAD